MTLEHSRAGLVPQADPAAPPVLRPGHLDALWFQVTGTLCNLRCAHCFIACSPENHAFGFLSLEEVARRLEESVALGVREYYFTGGEPFLHPRIVDILSLSLAYGPTTVLTNGTVLKARQLERLAETAAASRWSLEFRLSLDGCDAETNDPLRGAGSFERAIEGFALLLAHGFLPIVTVVRSWEDDAEPEVYARFVAALRDHGCRQPRIKVMPPFRLGAEAERVGGYDASDRIGQDMLADYDLDQLLCAHARVVTDRGIWVCPILLDSPDGRLGDELAPATQASFPLAHAACHTCWLHGAVCANAGGAVPEIGMAAPEIGIPEPGAAS